MAWLDPRGGPGTDAHGGPGYEVSWQPDGVGTRSLEDAWFDSLDDALAWARERTDAVVVRPPWDETRYYWAGVGDDARGLPRLARPE